MDIKAQIQENQASIDALTEELKQVRQNKFTGDDLQKASPNADTFAHDFKVCKSLTGHFGKIYALDWSDDRTTLLSAAQDGSLIVWNALSTNKLHMIQLDSSWVMACAMSPSGKLTASGGLDNLCTVYNLPDEPILEENMQADKQLSKHTGYLSGTTFLGEEKIISSSGDASCILWDIKSGKPSRMFKGHISDVMGVSLFPDSDLFVSGSCDHTCKVWDHRDQKANVLTFAGHDKDINAVDVSRSGNFFCSGGDDSKVILHDLRAMGLLQVYGDDTKDTSAITSCAFSQTSRIIFAGYDNATCFAWDSLTAEHKEFLNTHDTRVSCLGVNADGTALCTGGWDHHLRIWA